MSKKKAFSGSTMTLKDFHGGSIPSDLPLPSAPGVIVRPLSDHRQIPNAWGNNSMGRFDHHHNQHLRPGSAGTTRNFDEKSSFFSNPAHIGQNFDEDERKPLDGVSLPRRTVSDDSVVVRPFVQSNLEPLPTAINTESLYFVGKFSGRPVTPPTRFSGSVNPVGGSLQIQSGNSSVPNAWGTRKDAVAVSEPVSPWSVSRFVQASALEKVSSGRWQSKNLAHHHHHHHHPPDVEVIGYSDDAENNILSNGMIRTNERGSFDYEKARSPMYQDMKERNFLSSIDNGVSREVNVGGSQMQPPMPIEVLGDRPKLKLLPRSKPLETSEPPFVDYKQAYEVPASLGRVDSINEIYGKENPLKPEPAGAEDGNRIVERPKLNLKPRSQLLEQPAVIVEKERKALFGDARPRELVLKERGVDDVAINNLDPIQPPNRTMHDVSKTEIKPESAARTPRHGDRVDNFILDQRSRKDLEKKDNRADVEKTDEQRNSRRNNNWRHNNRDCDKQQQQQERRTEPETWRKPIDEPKPASPNAQGLRHGKVASALELAQAFSRSVSDVKAPGRNQVPFSRLTDDTREFYSGSTPRHHINSY